MKLQRFLDNEGLTQKEFGESVGVSQQMIQHLLAGRQCASLPLALRIEWETGGEITARSLAISNETDAVLDVLENLVDRGANFFV